jgi:hypothetical protein
VGDTVVMARSVDPVVQGPKSNDPSFPCPGLIGAAEN